MVRMSGSPSAGRKLEQYGDMVLIRLPIGVPTGCIKKLYLFSTSLLYSRTANLIKKKVRSGRLFLKYYFRKNCAKTHMIMQLEFLPFQSWELRQLHQTVNSMADYLQMTLHWLV